MNVDDRDAGKYLRYFTLLERDAIEAFDDALTNRPEKREAQQGLAREVTNLVHGEHALAAAQEVSGLLFGSIEPQSLSRDALLALQAEIPVFTLEPKDEITTQDVLEATLVGLEALFASKGDLRRMLQQGGVYMNGRRLSPEREPVSKHDLLGGEFLLIRKGSKSYGLVKVH